MKYVNQEPLRKLSRDNHAFLRSARSMRSFLLPVIDCRAIE